MMSDWRKDNGGADLSGIGKLNTNQLRKLAEELKLRIPKGIRKHQLKQRIISSVISNSSDWKLWAQQTKESSGKPSPSLVDGKTHWSPPRAGQVSQITEKYPEKGVRVMKIEEAYPGNENNLIFAGKTLIDRKAKRTKRFTRLRY